MLLARGGLDHCGGSGYDLSAGDALYLLACALGSTVGVTPDDILGTTTTSAQ